MFLDRQEPFIVSFTEANKLFLALSRLNEFRKISSKSLYSRKRYLLLSFICDRDIGGLDTTPLQTMFILGSTNHTISADLSASLNEEEKIAYRIGKLYALKLILTFKDFKYIATSFLILLIKILKSTIDLIGIILLTTLYSFYKYALSSPFNRREIDSLKNDLYTIYFWKTKEEKSIEYYYPDFNDQSNINSALATSFYGFKFITFGILSTFRFRNIHSALDFIKPIHILQAIYRLVLIHFYELSYVRYFSYSSFIASFKAFSSLHQRYYSLLNYYSADAILKRYRSERIYLWQENQIYNKSLSIGLLNSKYFIPELASNIITYYGFAYSLNSLPQYKPTQFEQEMGFCAVNNFMLQDKTSLLELKEAINNNSSKSSFSLARISLKRYKSPQLSIRETTPSESRYITYFSHSESQEIYICLRRFFRHYNYSQITYAELKHNDFYLRLHPSISLTEALRQLKKLRRESNLELPNFKIINSKEESILESISYTGFCIFSNSSYVNLALESKANVIAITTSYLRNPPIHINHLKKEFLTRI